MAKDAGIHYGMNPGNDSENRLSMGMHCINDRGFHKKVKSYDRSFNCAFNKFFHNCESGDKTSQKSLFLIIGTAPINAGVELSTRCRKDE